MSVAGAAPVWQWLLVAGGAAVVARAFTAVVGRLVGPQPGVSTAAVYRGIEVGFVAAAVTLWWWEVLHGGGLPLGLPVDAASRSAIVARHVAHAVLFTLLAAATWVDFRHRVIPDGITVPGVLLGLAATALLPDILLPVAREIPRDYAAPLLAPDVLGAFGPLRGAPPPEWLAARPAFSGLAAALAVYAIWWWVCTAPACDPRVAGDRGRMPRIDPRLLVLWLGVLGIGAAWWRGGDHWPALLTSLLGMLGAAAIVWLVREGASRALGQEAMGLGDVTLMAMVGAWLGWQASVLTCCLALFIGLGHGLLQVALRRERELPFGPSLCLGAALVVVGWRPVWERTADTFANPLGLALVVAAVIGLTPPALALWRRCRGRDRFGAA